MRKGLAALSAAIMLSSSALCSEAFGKDSEAESANEGGVEADLQAEESSEGGGEKGRYGAPKTGGEEPDAEETQDFTEECPSIESLIQNLPDRNLSHIFSLDLGYALAGFRHNGFGIGMNYEQKVFRYLSVKAGLSMLAQIVSDDGMRCVGFGSNLSTYCYPFGKGLEWLYFGLGIGTDFQKYSGTVRLPNPPEDVVVSLIPMAGWKQIVFHRVMVDFQLGYKLIIQNSNRFACNADYVNSGFSLGFKITIIWRRLLQGLLDGHISQRGVY